MAINPALLALLGQQALAPAPLEEPMGEPITVTAPEQLQYQAPAYRMNDAPLDDVMINQAAPDTSAFPRTQASPQEVARAQNMTGLPEHKGMFGVKGTFRDVLGLVGDALLMGNGAKPIYAPTRQREGLSDAMAGFGMGNPEADSAAIARVMARDPQAGAQLLQQVQQQQVAQQNAQTAAARVQNARTEQAQGLMANMMNMVRQKGDAALLPKLIAQFEKMTGMPASQFGVTPDMSLDDIGLYAYSGIKGQQQENIDLGRDRLAQQRELELLKEKGRMARDNPPAPRAAPNPTAASLAAPIIRKMEQSGYNSLTPAQKEVLQATGMDPTRRGVKKESAYDRMRNKGGATAAPVPATQPKAGSHTGFTVRKVN